MRRRAESDLTAHPGDFLREKLKREGVRQRELARELGIADSYLSDVLRGKRGVGTQLALRLEEHLELSAEFFLTMQMNHDLATAREANRKLTSARSRRNGKP